MCVCPFVCPSLPRRQVPIPFSAQCSLVGSGTLVRDLFLYRLGPVETARCRERARGHVAGNAPIPDSRHRTAPAAGWGYPGDSRCPFPVEGRRARVARGGKERRPFRRVTAAESRWVTHPGRPSLPGPERRGPGQPREREMPPAVSQARNWGHWATGTLVLGRGHRCTDLPGLEMALPGRRGAHTQNPAPGLDLSSPPEH